MSGKNVFAYKKTKGYNGENVFYVRKNLIVKEI